jgi:hypothetical protein
LLALLLVLPSCGGGNPPIPSPFPSLPPPGPSPLEPYDCENPPQAYGYVKAKRPWGDGNDHIVVLKAPLGARSLATLDGRRDAAAQAAGVAARHGISGARPHSIIRAFSAKLSQAKVDTLLADPGVRAVYQVGTVAVPPFNVAPQTAIKSWGLDRVDQRVLPLDDRFVPLTAGSWEGVRLVSLDTGVDRDVSDIRGRVTEPCWDSFSGSCADDHDHGTHTSCTMAGTTYGVAKTALLLRGRVLQNGQGSDTDVIRGIQWSADTCQGRGWRCAVNMSLGGSASDPLDAAVCGAIEAGLQFAIAAGNDNAGACGASPARVKQALTVGASNDRDAMTSFSNEGQCVDLFAPGEDIASMGRGSSILTWSGTSMAAPHVTALLGLLLTLHPDWTPAQLHAAVLAHATKGVISSNPDTTRDLLFVGGPAPAVSALSPILPRD